MKFSFLPLSHYIMEQPELRDRETQLPEFPPAPPEKPIIKWRGLIGFWLLGLCNNYGYVAVLTGATDILQNAKVEEIGARKCTYVSTGAVLLADIIPSLIIKAIGPFFPFCVNIQVAICVAISACSFFLIATFSWNIIVSMTAIALTSLITGLGEITFLQYSSSYPRSMITAWSSGTGAAGIIGSVSYTFLTKFLTFSTTFYILMMIPILMSIAFWAILPLPRKLKHEPEDEDFPDEYDGKKNRFWYICIAKFRYIPILFKYIIPFFLVYFLEYFINQTAFELVNFEKSVVKEQYKWLFVDYQLGVFLSRTSGTCFKIDRIWIMTVLQFINVVVFISEVIWYFMPCYWTVLLLTLWEGMLGGATYVNTYRRIATEITEPEKRRFAMAITGNGDSLGITLAGIIAMYVHNAICDIPKPTRWADKIHS